MLRLVPPTIEMEQEYLCYITEWENERIVPYSSGLNGKSYTELLEYMKKCRLKETVPEGLVPDRTYFMINEQGRILGAINLRLELNDYLMNFGGHIGFGIRPSERKKGYASKQLQLILPVAKSFGFDKVLVTCDDNNNASAKTIEACGGILEDKREEKSGLLTCRYWIAL